MAAPQPINERYEQERFSRSITRPVPRNVTIERTSDTTRRSSSRGSTVGRQTTNLAAKSGAVVLYSTSKAGKAVGKGMTRAGAALSGTVIGAPVGIALAAGGVGVQAGSAGLKAGSKVLRKIGDSKQSRSKKKLNPAKRVASFMDFMILGKFTMLWAFLLFPMALASIFFGGISSSLDSFTEESDVDGEVVKVVKYFIRGYLGLFNSFVDAIRAVTGFDLGALLEIFDPLTWFGALYMFVMITGILMMLVLLMYFYMTGRNALSGKGWFAKKALFLGGILGYAIPPLHLVPWFLFYALIVWKYPD